MTTSEAQYQQIIYSTILEHDLPTLASLSTIGRNCATLFLSFNYILSSLQSQFLPLKLLSKVPIHSYVSSYTHLPILANCYQLAIHSYVSHTHLLLPSPTWSQLSFITEPWMLLLQLSPALPISRNYQSNCKIKFGRNTRLRWDLVFLRCTSSMANSSH